MALSLVDSFDWCTAIEQQSGAGIRIVARVPAEVADHLMEDVTACIVRFGYIVVDANADLPIEQRRALWHRHVVLIHRGEATPVSARWIRELAQASPRAHAVVAVVGQPDRAREAAGVDLRSFESLAHVATGVLAQRALRFKSRGRHLAARRWTCAAVERARRSEDELGAAVAFVQLAKLSAAGPVEALIARGRRLLADLRVLEARSHVVAVLADAWLTLGEFDAAAAHLSAVDVECTLAGIEVPPWIRTVQSELACWQGRWGDADLWARAAGHPGWRAVAAYGRGDWLTVHLAASTVDALHAEWRALLTLLSRGIAGDRAGTIDAFRAVSAGPGPRRWRDTLVLEGLRMAGADEDAKQWVETVQARPRGPTEELLWRWVSGERGAARRQHVLAKIRRCGAEGIRRWGMGRQDMQAWAGVSLLLEQVQEADNPAAALRRGCRWAREYTGLDLVAIVSHDNATVLACEPDDRRSTMRLGDATKVTAVRYGGVRIGSVVLRGEAKDEGEVQAMASALATACAPALRARLDDLLLSSAGQALASDLLGVSPVMRALRDAVARAASSTFPVLIEGESGTGKELVARAVHRLSPRRDRRWAAVNCAALTDELLETELFGHVRGAFTGAMGPRVGLLEDAHEGTLFLDEVAELSPRAQAKLLRVLQEGEIRRVGENASRRVDVRLVTATNRPLAEAARQGTYREDLIFRLAVIRLKVPPLRARIEDIPLLAHSFWRAAAARVSTGALLAPDAIAALCRYGWPGNVRELQNVIAMLAVGGPTLGRIGARQVAAVLADRAVDGPLDPPLSLAAARGLSDRRVIASSLARHAGRCAAAARELGVSRQGLAKLIARLEVSKGA